MNASEPIPQGADDCPRATSVFLNVPYDDEYRGTFEALVLTIFSYGLWPRWANDTSGGSRMDRIVQGLRNCRFSIHDLSRCKGEGDENLARMNMPLELGMAMELAYPRKGAARRDHHWIVLMPDNPDYRRAITDVNGYDLLTYDGMKESAIRELATDLQVILKVSSPTVKQVKSALQDWELRLNRARDANDKKNPTWRQMVESWLDIAKDLQ